MFTKSRHGRHRQHTPPRPAQSSARRRGLRRRDRAAARPGRCSRSSTRRSPRILTRSRSTRKTARSPTRSWRSPPRRIARKLRKQGIGPGRARRHPSRKRLLAALRRRLLASSTRARPMCRWTPTIHPRAPRRSGRRRTSAASSRRAFELRLRVGRARQAPAARRRRCVGHLHIRLDGEAQGRRREPLLGRRVRAGRAAPLERQRQDRVLAGLSVSFDASCEEMWLAWGNGARSFPPRVRSCAPARTSGRGSCSRGITVISTVPTLAAMWDEQTLANVRLLILGGEACSPRARLAPGGGPRGVEHLRPDRGDCRHDRCARCRAGSP